MNHLEIGTLVDLLELRIDQYPNKTLFSFLDASVKPGPADSRLSMPPGMTYGGLGVAAKTIAAELQSRGAQGQRVLLIYKPGLEFIQAFWGCLYAGAIAVPAYPPRKNHHFERLQGILRNADAGFVLTTQQGLENFVAQGHQWLELAQAQWIATDELDASLADHWQPPVIAPEQLALLQYTSGSTGAPKGVMIQHQHLLANSRMIHQFFRDTPESFGVCWLPPYHDMGLIGGILQPIFVGAASLLMDPVAFLQRPSLWLRAMSDCRASTAGGPNFAYGLCVDSFKPQDCEGLDLSEWRVAFCGAEPVKAETLRRFSQTFSPYGFRESAFLPCYGMAEATLLITGGSPSARPRVKEVEADALRSHCLIEATADSTKTVALVSCGTAADGISLAIVDPETLERCPAGTIGEIWVQGENVAAGYWQQPCLTETIFAAMLQTPEAGPFLRTGDLGFLDAGELFVTGRLKELVIIRGRNYYPQEIEEVAQSAHPALRSNHGAVFTIEQAEEECLVLVQEVERTALRQLDPQEVLVAVRRAIAEQFELQLQGLILLKPAQLPKTTSGKVQRLRSREKFLQKDFEPIFEFTSVQGILPESVATPPQPAIPTPAVATPMPTPSLPVPESTEWSTKIEAWLIEHVAEQLGLTSTAVNRHEPLANYGLSSLIAIRLSGELQDWLEIPIEPTILYDYPAIAPLAAALAQMKAEHHLGRNANTIVAATPTASPQPRRRAADSEIAIVGMGCRFPGANNPQEYWHLLLNNLDAITEIPADRWNIDDFYDPNLSKPGTMNTRWGGFIDDVAGFDAEFFKISAREASMMDPQQRLLLEVAWQALEQAGMVPEQSSGSQTGVFIGISSNDYGRLMQEANLIPDPYFGTSQAFSIAANRLSYLMNWHGPSLAIDTACSSSLVAIHEAALSLRQRECNLAIAGGVNLILNPDLTIAFSQARMMAADGRCKTFDAQADGYVRSEGCGILVLKRIEDALRDGNRVYAILKGSAVNQDGRSNGLTAPNTQAQVAVIRQALKAANVSPHAVSYVESHGTGTALGDPIEINALRTVFGPGRSPDSPLAVGSVKTNLGHLEAAAGVASVMKVALSLYHHTRVPSLHYTQINPLIDLADGSLKIATQPEQWQSQQPRMKGVSSFGFGGTNAHLVLASPAVESPIAVPLERSHHLLTLSAQTPSALQALQQKVLTYLTHQPTTALGDLCWSLNGYRSKFSHRSALIAGSVEQLRSQLQAIHQGQAPEKTYRGTVPTDETVAVGFLLTGQGSQYPGMGQQLFQTQPVFRAALEECATLLEPWMDLPLLSLLYPTLFPGAQPADALHQTQYTQPALFALEYALAQLWQSWGVQPAVLMGHSLGEYVAACLAGVFSLSDGLKLIAHRAKLMQQLPHHGGMSNVWADEQTVQQAIAPYGDRLSIAAYNGPTHLVVSGVLESLAECIQALESQGVNAKHLLVSHAFHSALMEPMLAGFRAVADSIHYQSPKIKIISTLTGTPIGDEMSSPEYWVRQIRQPVRFEQAMTTLLSQRHDCLLEVGPQPTLLGMARRLVGAPSSAPWLGLPSLEPHRSDWEVLLSAVGQLAIRGIVFDWQALDAPYAQKRLDDLPTYPFEHKSYWFTQACRAAVQGVVQSVQGAVSSPAAIQQSHGSSKQWESAKSVPGGGMGERRSLLLTQLQDTLSQTLYGETRVLDIHASLLTLGLDSINLLDLVLKLEQNFGITIPVRQFFEELNTLDKIAIYLDEKLPPELPPRGSEVGETQNGALAMPNNLLMTVEQLQMTLVDPHMDDALAGVIQEQLSVLQTVMLQQLQTMRSHPPLVDTPFPPSHAPTTNQPISTPSNQVPQSSVGSTVTLKHDHGSNGQQGNGHGQSYGTLMDEAPEHEKTLEVESTTVQTSSFQPNQSQIYPLSIAQQRMWLTEVKFENQNVYLIPVAVKIDGALNIEALAMSLNQVVARHDSLRTTFELQDGQLLQRVHPCREVAWSVRAMDEDCSLELIQQSINRLCAQPFDLASDCLMRVELLQYQQQQHVLLLVFHHLVADAWSAGIFLQEVLTAYPSLLAGQAVEFTALPLQYGDYSAGERQGLDSSQSLDHWRTVLADFPAPLCLPTDAPRPPHRTFVGNTYFRSLPSDLVADLKVQAQRCEVTPFMVLLATYSLLLHQYSGQSDVIIGSTLANRQAQTQTLIGLFLQTLLFRVRVSRDTTIDALLKQVRQVALDAFAHPWVPFEALAAEDHSDAPTDWFQAMFILQNIPRVDLALPDLTLSMVPVHGGTAKCDLSLWMEMTASGLRAEWEYNSELFEEATIVRMAIQFEHLLALMLQPPSRPLQSLAWLGASEQQQVERWGWGSVLAHLPKQPIVERFEAQVRQMPTAIALEHQGVTWSYERLNGYANQIAHMLWARGVSREDLVGVCLERSPELIATLWGILKAGGTYIPLDPSYPVERLDWMMADAQMTALVTRFELMTNLGLSAPTVLDIRDPAIAQQLTTNPPGSISLSQMAYIIYTSGSTGTPKGVCLTHRGLANFVQEAIARYGFCSTDRVLQFASISFDAAVEEIYGTLCSGGTLVLRNDDMLSSSQGFAQACADQRITVLDLPTAFWHRLVQDLTPQALSDALRLVIIGGERVLPQRVLDWQRLVQGREIRLLNTYGPTEATVVATTYEIPFEANPSQGIELDGLSEIPIGRPLGNIQALVLDPDLNLVPIGVAGELYLGGECLAAGYLNRPDLTAERFIGHPWQAEQKLYRTGDRVRLLPSGDLMYLGRTDDQVKVRGFRVEMGEIETVLQTHPTVRECAVVAEPDEQGILQLRAYVAGEQPTPQELRSYVQARLPEYMVPVQWQVLEALPLSTSGKLDRKALRQLPLESVLAETGRSSVSPMAAPTYVAPRTPTEAAISFIVAEVLKVERVGIEDNFFKLGGHSLSAMQLLGRISTLFGQEISLKALFATPTVAALAAQLQTTPMAQTQPQTVGDLAGAESTVSVIPPVDRSQPLFLSAAQERLWFLNQLEGASATYNLPFALHLKGVVNPTAIAQCLNAIVARHESLRTTFGLYEEQGVQVIAPTLSLTIPVVEPPVASSVAFSAPVSAGLHSIDAEWVQQALAEEAETPFSLETGPLLRVKLLRLAPDDHVLLVTLHHIIADAWSLGVFIQEIMALYPAFCGAEGQAPALPALPCQYVDYAHWQRQQFQAAVSQERLRTWADTFRDAPLLLDLPSDRPRPPVQTFRGHVVRTSLSAQLTQSVRAFAQEQRTTVFMVLLATYSLVLQRYSRQRDLVIGVPTAGRLHPELEPLIGFFINTLPLRFQMTEDLSVTDYLSQVQALALDGFEHQDIPFEKLIEQLALNRDLSYLPLCQVMFVLQNAPTQTLTLPGLELTPLPTHGGVARFDLTLSIHEGGPEGGDRLNAEWEYNCDLFDANTIERMAAQFEVLLLGLITQPQQRVSQLPLLPQGEQQQLQAFAQPNLNDRPVRCIHHWFEDQVRATPMAIALTFADQSLSYDQLNQRANVLAHTLQQQGIAPETRVGICLERSLEMVIAMLAVLKAGGAYVPLDPSYPRERLQGIIEDAQLQLLIIDSALDASLWLGCWPRLVRLDPHQLMDASHLWTTNPLSVVQPHHLAYVIYTSGSTGKPKGVMVEHRGLGNLAFAQINAFAVTPASRILQMASFSFDASVSEIWMGFCAGATVCLAQFSDLVGTAVVPLLQAQQITHLTLPPSALSVLSTTDLRGVERLIVAGEACPAAVVDQWGDRPGLYNAYGPTEASVCATIAQCAHPSAAHPGAHTTHSGPPPIGAPIENVEVYVLDEFQQQVPIGVPGELYIGGIGIARGYFQRPDLSAERFVPHPFSVQTEAMLYRTGDLGRFRPDGQLDYLGRLDHQVKLRGFRIELAEIEAVLREHPQVQDALVMLSTQVSGTQPLVAYVVTPVPVVQPSLRTWVSERLPQFMVPAAFIELEQFPSTPNGKVDRNALPALTSELLRQGQTYLAPRNPVELKLAQHWSELLGIEPVGVEDNFFELGGHSLLAVQLISRIQRDFAVQIQLKPLFEQPTIAQLAELIMQERFQSCNPVLLEQLLSEIEALTPSVQ